jgi:hypothetical protein
MIRIEFPPAPAESESQSPATRQLRNISSAPRCPTAVHWEGRCVSDRLYCSTGSHLSVTVRSSVCCATSRRQHTCPRRSCICLRPPRQLAVGCAFAIKNSKGLCYRDARCARQSRWQKPNFGQLVPLLIRHLLLVVSSWRVTRDRVPHKLTAPSDRRDSHCSAVCSWSLQCAASIPDPTDTRYRVTEGNSRIVIDQSD